MNPLKTDIFTQLKDATSPLITEKGWRLIATLLSLAFFHHFPYLVATSYMSWEGFFSYDMFTSGKSGIKTFYWWTEIFSIIGSFYTTGSIFIITKNKFKYNQWRLKTIEFSSHLIINAIVLCIIFFALYFPNKITKEGFTIVDILPLLLISAWIMIHIAIIIAAPSEKILASLGIGVLLLSSISIINPGSLALPYSFSLQFFGNGGGLPATLTLSKQNMQIQGKLILASPEHIYIYPEGQQQLLIIERNKVTQLSVRNLSGFGHGPKERPQTRSSTP